ncbi:MAG: EpsI family protein [Gemmatimonadetes bacterium]|nr:EpsI family protein [Gemmatimonadota bacterium]
MSAWMRWAPAGVLVAGCLLVAGQREQVAAPLAAPLASVPSDFQGLTAKDVTIDADQQKVAGMSSYLMRVFKRDSLDVMSLYVGYYDYQRQGKSIHSPKNCLPGAGWEPMSHTVVPVTIDGTAHPVNRYLLGKGQARALVYYWYEGRGRVAADEYKVKWELLRDAALTGRTEEALVRLVIPLAPDVKATQPAAERLRKLLPSVAQADSLALAAAMRYIPAVMRALPKPAAT